MPTYVFVDNSNFYHGLQYHRRISPLCIDVNAITKLWGQINQPSYIIGSAMDTPEHDALYWTRWQQKGFTVLASKQKSKEVFVDDALHAQILNLLLHVNRHQSNKLILVSGDGNDNFGRTCFPECIRIALKIGWSVDIWCWQEGMNNSWTTLKSQWPQQLNIYHFNFYIDQIINFQLLTDIIYPRFQTEEDRLERVMLSTRLYVESLPARYPQCYQCNKFKRIPRPSLCQCHQVNHDEFLVN